MTRSMQRRTTLLLLAATLGATLSCDASRATGPSEPTSTQVRQIEADSASLLGLFGRRPLSCSASEPQQVSGVIGALGGVLNVGDVTVSIPLGALLSDVNVIVTIPASNNREVDISVEGHDTFLFELPIAVTMSYSGCSLGFLGFLRPVVAWHFDPETRELIEQMPSVDDRLLRTVTFTTGHLTGYILAN